MEDYKKLVNRLREESKDSRKAVLSMAEQWAGPVEAVLKGGEG